uniref:Uncharacterized protein LOC114345920 n=1 Tax=Diabrotica virgifera virgifera TaxID=50390 RepID=A0A6P7GRR3_DIAVI
MPFAGFRTRTYVLIYLSFIKDVSSDQIHSKFPYFEECLIESGTSVDDLKAKPVKITHEFICFYKCLYDKIGAIDKDGKIVPGLIIEHIKKYKEISTDQEKSTVDCLEKIPKITICEDLEQATNCLKPLKN